MQRCMQRVPKKRNAKMNEVGEQKCALAETRAELESDLRDLTKTELRSKYRLTANSHRNMLSRAKGRASSVSSEFMDFKSFLRIMGPRPAREFTLDRIDNKQGYSKANCRWADKREQANNRSNTVSLTVKGKTQSLADWARETRQSPATLRSRRARGYSDENIVYGQGTRVTTVRARKGIFEATVWIKSDLEMIKDWYVQHRRQSGKPYPELTWLFLTLNEGIREFAFQRGKTNGLIHNFKRALMDDDENDSHPLEHREYRALLSDMKRIESRLEDLQEYLRRFDRVEREELLAGRVSKAQSEWIWQIRTYGKILTRSEPFHELIDFDTLPGDE